MKPPQPLRLLAQDPADLEVISAALQDAVGLIGDLQFEPRAQRFTFALNRYRWEGPRRGRGERVRAALQIGAVLSAKSKKLRRNAGDAVVELLALSFEPDGDEDSPGGAIALTFSGGGELRLEVECVDAALADVSAPWRASSRPGHDAGAEGRSES